MYTVKSDRIVEDVSEVSHS